MEESQFSGFYKLSVEKRRAIAGEFAGLSKDELALFAKESALPIDVADRMVENVIGTFPLPYGVATNFVVNGREILVPMVLEEPSVVAAASNAAKMARENGGFAVSSTESIMIGEMSLVRLEDADKAFEYLNSEPSKKELVRIATQFAEGITKYGGGVRSVEVEQLSAPSGKIILLKFYVDVCDAMGANTINTIMELSTPEIEKIAKGQARVKILSNLAPKRLARASAKWSAKTLGGKDVVEKIIEGYELAVVDKYRCATHNKGIMNGIDAVAIASGQDFRAIEAGCHSYAAIDGVYKPLTKYYKDKNGDLIGEIEIPAPVGIVGGAIRTHPLAALSLKMMKVKKARELGEVMAAVGLAQNFAALRAITTEGIQKGHMRLHAKNIAVAAGAQGAQIDIVADELVKSGKISVANAQDLLKKMQK